MANGNPPSAGDRLDHDSDVHSFWAKRWSGPIQGWHVNDVNPHLRKHISSLVPEESCKDAKDGTARNSDDNGGSLVFVPLCGKSVDITYLASLRGVAEAVGVDIVKDAGVAFAAENPQLSIREVTVTPKGDVDQDYNTQSLSRFVGEECSMLIADLFDLNAMDDAARTSCLGTPTFDAVYDRASLVAIAPALREEYVELIGKILRPGGTMLLVTLDRRAGTEEGMAAGPPFSVNESEVRRLFESKPWVKSVSKLDEMPEFQTEKDRERWAKKGVTELNELVFAIKVRE